MKIRRETAATYLTHTSTLREIKFKFNSFSWKSTLLQEFHEKKRNMFLECEKSIVEVADQLDKELKCFKSKIINEMLGKIGKVKKLSSKV